MDKRLCELMSKLGLDDSMALPNREVDTWDNSLCEALPKINLVDYDDEYV